MSDERMRGVPQEPNYMVCFLSQPVALVRLGGFTQLLPPKAGRRTGAGAGQNERQKEGAPSAEFTLNLIQGSG